MGCRGGCPRRALWAGVRTGWKPILWVREGEKVLRVFLQFFSLLSLFQPAVVAPNSAAERHRHFIIPRNWIITWGNNWCPLFCNQLMRFKGAGDGVNKGWDSRQSTSVPWPLRRQHNKLGLFLLVFFLWLQLPFSMLYPTLTLTEQWEEPQGGVCVIQVCVCMCVHMWTGLLNSDSGISLAGSFAACRLLEKALYFHWDKPHECSPLSPAYLYLLLCSYSEG